MKDKEKIVKLIGLGLLIIIIIMCLVLGISYIYKKVYNVNKKQQDRIELVKSNYNQFSLLADKFNTKREELNGYLSENTYYENLYLIKDELYIFYGEYDEIISKIQSVATSLEISCKNEFTNEEINKKCNSYKEAYEMMINIYLNDIKIYNETVKKYNDTVNDNFAQNFESKYATEYIDVNKDGVYSGKDE